MDEQQEQGNPRPSGEIKYYESIHQKEEMCSEMVGHNTMRFAYEEKKGEK